MELLFPSNSQGTQLVYIYKTEMFVCPSYFVGGLPREMGRVDRKEGAMGRMDFLCQGRWGGWTEKREAIGRGGFNRWNAQGGDTFPEQRRSTS